MLTPTRSLGVSGTSAVGSRPRAPRVGASYGSGARAPGCAHRCLLWRRGARPDPAERRRRAPEEAWGPRGGRGCRGQGPGRRERRRKGVAGDAATSPPIAGLGPPGGPGTPGAWYPARARLNGRVTQPESPPGGGGRQVTGAGRRRTALPACPGRGPAPGEPQCCQRRSWEGSAGDLAEKPRWGRQVPPPQTRRLLARRPPPAACPAQRAAQSRRKRRGPVRASKTRDKFLRPPGVLLSFHL